MRVLIWVAAALLLVTASPVPAENWADNHDSITMQPEYQRSKAICRSLKRMPPLPRATAPTDATPPHNNRSSEALYYGIGVPPDPARALQHALREGAAPGDGATFSGDVMLMTIYANGVGAPRDLDRAIAIACNLDGAPAEMDGRVNHLAKLRDQRWAGHDFSFCDDITSGYAQGLCAAHDAAMEDAKREQRLSAVMAGWSDAEKRAFQPLERAEKGYAEARAGNEVDQSGTARAAMAIDEQQDQEKDFLDLLQSLETGTVPATTGKQVDAADAELNAAYQRIQHVNNTASWGTVTKDGIRMTQRAWLRYRDAWIAFARVRYPRVAPESLVATLTEKRTALLQGSLQ